MENRAAENAADDGTGLRVDCTAGDGGDASEGKVRHARWPFVHAIVLETLCGGVANGSADGERSIRRMGPG